MCLAIPGKVIKKLNDDNSLIDYGDGTKRKVNTSLVDINIGDYVLVHAGFAIEKLNKKEAKETLAIFRELLSIEEEN